jgi:AhpD family alkylhydroperoxidase
MTTHMNEAVTELDAIGAAMACNCEPCFKYHFDKARKLGVSVEDMRAAVNTGLSVKATPHRKVVETAERYLTHGSGEEAPVSCCSDTPGKSAGQAPVTCCSGA